MEVNGSETSSGSSGMMLTYDPFTMMTMREVKGSRILDSQYDGRKERVLKIDNINGTVTKTLYLHGLNDFPIMQKSSAGDERLYVCGLSGLVATRVNANWYYVHKDHLGSTRLVTNSSLFVSSSVYRGGGKRAILNCCEGALLLNHKN